MTADAFEDRLFANLLNPDEVGESEYRTVYGHLQSVVESANIGGDNVAQMVLASLDELVATARNIQRRVREIEARTEVARELVELDERLSGVLAAHSGPDLARRGVEIFGRLRKLQKEVEAMPDGVDKTQAEELATALDRRVLTDLFEIDPDKVTSP